MPFSPDVDSAISNASQTFGVPLDYMRQMAQIESGGDPNAGNKSGAAGLYQFMPRTAQSYDLTDPYDPVASANAAAQLTLDNQTALRNRLGRDPTPGELYLAHQQGAAGAGGLLSNPDAPAASIIGAKAVTQNGGSINDTAAQFANRWTSKFGAPGGPAMTMPASAGGPAQATGVTPTSLTATLATPAADQTQSQQASPYGAVSDALQAVAGQKQQKAPGMQMLPVQRPRSVSLPQARQLFDASRFYTMLKGQG